METFVQIIERVGVPVAMCMAFGYFIWKQNQFIQNESIKATFIFAYFSNFDEIFLFP